MNLLIKMAYNRESILNIENTSVSKNTSELKVARVSVKPLKSNETWENFISVKGLISE
jgi:hypothetical protein